MKKYKYLVVDYDGTLVNDDKKVTPKTLKAINDFAKRGGVFVVCTGRMTKGIDHFLKAEGLNCLLASFNGAEFRDIGSDELLYQKPIDNATCIKCFKILEEYGVSGQCYPNGEYVVAKETERTIAYSNMMRIKPNYQNPVSKFLIESKNSSPKILVYDSKEKLDLVEERLKRELTECEVIRSFSEHIDINLKGVSKGNAIKMIADYYGITVEDIIAVGDAGNDIPMLESAGFPIAMGNALLHVKEICKAVCPDNNSDGIAYIIEKYCI